jgi:hypothetical protein
MGQSPGEGAALFVAEGVDDDVGGVDFVAFGALLVHATMVATSSPAAALFMRRDHTHRSREKIAERAHTSRR